MGWLNGLTLLKKRILVRNYTHTYNVASHSFRLYIEREPDMSGETMSDASN